MARWWCAFVLSAACARGGGNADDGTTDAPCELHTFFHDGDGDMHGDPAMTVEACEQPPGAVAAGDDCDDRDANRYPGAQEICDGIDNDCNAATIENCPVACTPIRRPPPDDTHVYLFCNANLAWTQARSACVAAMFTLGQIDDGPE